MALTMGALTNDVDKWTTLILDDKYEFREGRKKI